jgi:predicted nucleic acid-binding protein
MKIFLDANILVCVLNKEYPAYTHTSRILSLADAPGFRLFTSPVCLAIAFYFAEKKYKVSAKQKLQLLIEHIEIAGASQDSVRLAIGDPAVKDFEDGLKYYSALEAGCQCIITEDKGDFYFSRIEVLGSLAFYQKYMARK